MDIDTLMMVAVHVCSHARPIGEQPTITRSWAQSYKRRMGMSHLRSVQKVRMPLSASEIIEVNVWHRDLSLLFASPHDYGLMLPDGFQGGHLRSAMVLGTDETLLQFCPGGLRGMCTPGGRVVDRMSNDKRQATGTPVLSMSGNIITVQIIWRGTTQKCHVELPDEVVVDPRIYHTHSPKKCQTGCTFEDLLVRVLQDLDVVRTKYCLGSQSPALIVMDHVMSHDKNQLEKVQGRTFCQKLFKWSNRPLYVWLTIPNRSHLCNPGDQMVNRSLRTTIRSACPGREIRHAMNVHDRAAPSRTGVDKSCKVVKSLLLQWISRWCQDSHTEMLVHSSFKVLLQQMPQTDSVDDIDVPVKVIYLPPPLQPVASAAVGDDALNAVDAASDPSLDSDAALASSAEEEDPFAPALLSDPPAARVHAPAHHPQPKPKPARAPRYKSAAVVALLRKKRLEEAAEARNARAQKRQWQQEESQSESEPEDEPMSPEVQANSADSA